MRRKTLGLILVLILILTGLAFAGGAKPKPVEAEPAKVEAAEAGKVVYPVVDVLDPVAPVTERKTLPMSPRLDTLAGKSIWVFGIEVDPVLMPIVRDMVIKAYPTAKVRYIEPSTGENPWLGLRKENYPDAVIVGNGF